MVARPTKWGNPFTIADCLEVGFARTEVEARFVVVEAFRDWLTNRFQDWWMGPECDRRLAVMVAGLPDLHGRDLACWCREDVPCHGDVLLELANR